MTTISVRDGARELRFDGELLSSSTSGGVGRTRWVEFQLYRTASGHYVLTRIGQSRYYHSPSCSTVRRNRIQPQAFADVDLSFYVPCETCTPRVIYDTQEVHPEQPRYWTQVSESARGVVDSLYKVDDAGNSYLTNVARRLLEDASENDEAVREAYYCEYID